MEGERREAKGKGRKAMGKGGFKELRVEFGRRVKTLRFTSIK